MNPGFVAADVRRLKLLEQNDIRASLRRLLRFMGSRREISFRGILSPPSGERLLASSSLAVAANVAHAES
jgi:hypothetical protein